MPFMGNRGKMAPKRKFFEDRKGSTPPKLRKRKNEQSSSLKVPSKGMLSAKDMEEEAMLEKLVLGDLSSMLERLGDEDVVYPRLNLESDDSGVEECLNTPEEPKPTTSGRQPAWHDEEDSELCIQEAILKQNRKGVFPGKPSDAYTGLLRNKFNTIVGAPKWAKLRDEDDDDDYYDDEKNLDLSDSDDDVMRHANRFISKSHSNLPKDVLNIKAVRNLNADSNCEGSILTSVQFHPKSSVALIAGLSGVTSIVEVDGDKNSKLHSVKFEKFPISTAKFTSSGEEFLVGSRDRGYFYRYDMMEGRSLKVTPQVSSSIANFKHFQISPDGNFLAVAGRFGNIYLLCARSNEFIAVMKMNGEVSSLTFNSDGSQLFSHGDTGEVYVWDVKSRTCSFRFIDDGCISGTALAVSPNGQFLATGSAHGVVNVYETSSIVKENRLPKPSKIIYNLTTQMSFLRFNSTSEILAMGSSYKNNAIRLVHFPSMTVFNNFPGWLYKVGLPHEVDFSLRSGYFSVASNSGSALLYRLQHYGNF